MAKRGKIKKQRQNIEAIERPERLRKYKMYFLIVCEDEQTEPAYFKKFQAQFPEKTLYLDCVGTGRDQLGVVEEAIVTKEVIELENRKKIDFVWVVFDKDDAEKNESKLQRFTAAFNLARKNKFHIGFSNEVFELWLLLHLEDIHGETKIPRSEIYARLEQSIQKAERERYLDETFLPFVYQHGKTEVLKKIEEFGDEERAIEQAKKLSAKFEKIDPIESNPSTTIHQLVVELRDWIRYYNY
jgi:hypothetical protein